jgi:hypothetical protein
VVDGVEGGRHERTSAVEAMRAVVNRSFWVHDLGHDTTLSVECAAGARLRQDGVGISCCYEQRGRHESDCEARHADWYLMLAAEW